MQIARNTLAFQADCKHTCWTVVGGRIRWSRCKKCRLWSARPTLQCRAQWEETRFQKFTLQSFKLDLSYSSLDLVDEMLAFQNIFVSAFWKAVPFAPSFKTKTHKKLKTSWKKKKHTCIVFARFYTAVSAVPPKTRSKMGSSAQMLHVSEITS